MDLFGKINDWEAKLAPILERYKDRKHPLDYHNLYQLVVMVVLSAQDSDANINKIAPRLFLVYPNMESLSTSNADSLIPYISKVRNFGTKTNWLIEIAQTTKKKRKHTFNDGRFNRFKRNRAKICQCNYTRSRSSCRRNHRRFTRDSCLSTNWINPRNTRRKQSRKTTHENTAKNHLG